MLNDIEKLKKIRQQVYADKSVTAIERQEKVHKARLDLLVNGKRCCMTFLKRVFGVSNSFLYHAHAGTDKLRKSPKHSLIRAWFMNLLNFCDRMPDEDNKFQLTAPYKHTVFEWFEDDMKAWKVATTIGRSWFMKVWKNTYPQIVLRKYLRFSKCKECVELRKIKWDRTADKKDRQQAGRDMIAHWRIVKGERAFAVSKKLLALENDDVMSIAMDGTDQLPFGVPHWAQHTKEVGKDRLKNKLVLVTVHGHGTYVYDHLRHIKGDPNLTIEALQRTFKAFESDGYTHTTPAHSIPVYFCAMPV